MLIKSIVLILFVIVLCSYLFFIRQNRYRKRILVLFVVVYAVILWWFTLYRQNPESNLSNYIVPFSSFWQITQLRWSWSGEYLFRAIVGNMVLFIPVGVFVTAFQKKKYQFLLSGIIGFFISLAIELLQLSLSLGSFETDDLITNTRGAVIDCSITLLVLERSRIQAKEGILLLLPILLFVGVMTAISFVPICKDLLQIL